MKSPIASGPGRRPAKLLVWAALPVAGLAGVVQLTGVGIDLLLLAAAILALLALERSLGDWIAEWFGPFSAAAIFVILIVAVSWYFLSSTLGRSKTDRFFTAAERRGYRTVYYETPPPAPTAQQAPPPATASTSHAQSAPAASGGVVASGNAKEDTSRRGAVAQARGKPGDSQVATTASDGAPAPVASADSRATAASGWAGSLFRRSTSAGPAVATHVALSVSPAKVPAARRTTITAVVTAASGNVTRGTVEFTVNGLGAGRKTVNPDGSASTTFIPQLAGTYEVRARFVGTSEHTASLSNPQTLEVIAKR